METRMETEATPHTTNGNGAVAILQPPRLPYHPAIEERFGVDKASWKALTEAIYPSAKTTDSVVMALSYCRARKLDPFKKPVHIVPMWSASAGGYVETVWPGISELRTTAFRTGQYAGCDETEFGPEIEQTFKGRVKVKGEWQDKSITLRFPEWARITVYRRGPGGEKDKYVGPKVRWLEAYACIGNSELPNEMWENRTEGQLDKCAEAASLRKAFPEELGNMLAAEEMEGRRIDSVPASHRDQHVAGNAKPTLATALDNLANVSAPQTQPPVVDGELVETEPDADEPADKQPPMFTPPDKTALLASIDKIESKLGALAWARDNQAALDKLTKKDRAIVDAAFQAQQDEVPD